MEWVGENNEVTAGYSPAEVLTWVIIHSYSRIFIEHLLCTKHYSRHYIYISEQNIQRPHSLGAYILVGKKPLINKKYDTELFYRMLHGDKYCGEKKR